MAIVDIDHEFTKNESMQKWIGSGELIETWGRLTTLIIVTDKNKEELQYLRNPLTHIIDGEIQSTGMSKYYFTEPSPESDMYQELFLNGQVSLPFEIVNTYINERT